MKRSRFVAIVAFFFLPSFASFPSFPAFAQGEPVDVRADQVEYFDPIGKVVASGNVVVTREEVKLTCDQATIYMETKDAYLRGRVRFFQPDGLLKGEEIIYNFQTKKGTILKAESEAGAWRSKGESAEKVSETSYLHHKGYMTSCDFEEPHTRMQAKEVRVFLDDRVVLKRVVMYLGKIPVLYLPSYTHPLDDKRPRVTLIPGKDKQWGLFLLTSWRLYLHENLQGRIHVDHRERLGLASGVDMKYELPEAGEGIFRSYYTHQRSIQREHPWSKYTSPEDDRPTTELERFRVFLRHRWKMDPWTLFSLNYHPFKDPTVVKDFFPEEYEKDQAIPQSSLSIVRSAPRYGLNFFVNSWVNRFQPMEVQWPSIGLNIRPIGIPWLPVLGQRLRVGEDLDEAALERLSRALPGIFSGSYWQYQSSFGFKRAHAAARLAGYQNSYQRVGTVQEIGYSTRFFRWLNIHIPFSFQQETQSRGAVLLKPQFQQSVSAGADLSTRFFRAFPIQTNWLGLNIHRLRHIVTPTLAYKYRPPPTLGSDRLRESTGLIKENSLGPGIEHKLQTKRWESGHWVAVDLVRFTNTFGYDLEGTKGRGGRLGGIGLDLEANPYPWLTFESDASIDPHFFWGKPTAINFDWVLHPVAKSRSLDEPEPKASELPLTEGLEKLPWFVGIGWRYSRNISSQLTTEADFALGKKWRMGLFQAFDVKRFVTETQVTGPVTVKKIHDTSEYQYRLMRDLHEWTVELVVGHQRSQGESILLLFRLKAAPEMPLEYERSYHRPKAGRNFPKY